MKDESSTVLNNLRTAHYGDRGVDLSSQEVHELWAYIEAKEIILSCMQILSSQEVENTVLKQHPKPIEFWSDEKKELYRRNESWTIKSGREEEIVKECNDVATPIDVALRKRIAELEGKIDKLTAHSDRFPNKSGWYYAGCPRCGSMNITTAGVCANCGWS